MSLPPEGFTSNPCHKYLTLVVTMADSLARRVSTQDTQAGCIAVPGELIAQPFMDTKIWDCSRPLDKNGIVLDMSYTVPLYILDHL